MPRCAGLCPGLAGSARDLMALKQPQPMPGLQRTVGGDQLTHSGGVFCALPEAPARLSWNVLYPFQVLLCCPTSVLPGSSSQINLCPQGLLLREPTSDLCAHRTRNSPHSHCRRARCTQLPVESGWPAPGQTPPAPQAWPRCPGRLTLPPEPGPLRGPYARSGLQGPLDTDHLRPNCKVWHLQADTEARRVRGPCA